MEQRKKCYRIEYLNTQVAGQDRAGLGWETGHPRANEARDEPAAIVS